MDKFRSPRRVRSRGANPRASTLEDLLFQPSEARIASGEHKTAQLCRQVFRSLSYAFGELDDEVLQNAHVAEVTPAPNASRLSITVCFEPPFELEDVLGRLARAKAFLRARVAADVNRKRAPELAFEIALIERSEP